MSDDLVKRFQMVGQYDEWRMEQVDGYGEDRSSETEWVKADDHAAALAAKDEKMDWCANLSMQRLVAVRELGDLLGEALSEIVAKDAEIARLRLGLQSIAANTCCNGCGEAAMVARAALNAQHKGETP